MTLHKLSQPSLLTVYFGLKLTKPDLIRIGYQEYLYTEHWEDEGMEILTDALNPKQLTWKEAKLDWFHLYVHQPRLVPAGFYRRSV